VTDAHFVWRISAAARQLRLLLEKRERGEWTWRTTDELGRVERHIRQMTDQAQLAAIRAALPEEEKVCDGYR
jgi:hypothetical protein